MNDKSLHWDLRVLSRAVAYNNLSGAAQHIGLSQPQLSRIVARLEAELQVTLLDREARRRSAWTPAAFRLSEVYSQSSRKLEAEILKATGAREPKHLKVGTLEGLIPLAIGLSHELQQRTRIEVIEVDVQDLNRLEERFFEGELDVILSSRAPGRRKPKYFQQMGFQSLERVAGKTGTEVLSSFEFATQSRGAPGTRKFVSNSLEARKAWVRAFGGDAVIPSAVRRSPRRTQQDEPVLLLGAERLGPVLWEKLSSIEAKLEFA